MSRDGKERLFSRAVRYVTLNPVRARLVKRAGDRAWSSRRAHLAGVDDAVVRVAPVLERVGDFAAFLDEGFDEDAACAPLRRAESVGRPIGGAGLARGAGAADGAVARAATARAEAEGFGG